MLSAIMQDYANELQTKTNNKMKPNFKELPVEIRELMLKRQVEQGNPRDESVFEREIMSNSCMGGFYWDITPEGSDFWIKILFFGDISHFYSDISHFYTMYPKTEQPQQDIYGLQTTFNDVVMLVSSDKNNWYKRVVFAVRNGKYMAWTGAETIEQAKQRVDTTAWNYAKPLDKVRLTKQDISNGKGVGVPAELIEIVEG